LRSAPLAVLLLLLALLAGVLWLRSMHRAAEPQRIQPPPIEHEVSPVPLAEPTPTQRAPLTDTEPPTDSIDSHPSDLAARLALFAQIELAATHAGHATPEQSQQLENLLAPSLQRPGELRTILEHLVARTWHMANEELPSLTEFGGVRFLYWALLLHHTAGHPHANPEAGRDLFLALASVLPQIDPPLRDLLVNQILGISVESRSLVELYVTELIGLRAQFLEHREIYSALLVALGDAMSPAERDAFFGVLLMDAADPVLAGTTLRNLLAGTRPDLALALAEELFDAAGATAALQASVAQAVVMGCADPYQAAEFLERRAQALRNAPQPWMALGARPGGFLALEACYQRLASADADPRAREMLVMGMRSAEAGELERVSRIALTDSHVRVRGQAYLSLTSSASYAPSSRDLADLSAARAAGVPALHVVLAAENVARRSQGNLRREAVALLREIALDGRADAGERRSAVNALRGLVPDAEFQQLEGNLPDDH
jgi:hypothetical protein